MSYLLPEPKSSTNLVANHYHLTLLNYIMNKGFYILPGGIRIPIPKPDTPAVLLAIDEGYEMETLLSSTTNLDNYHTIGVVSHNPLFFTRNCSICVFLYKIFCYVYLI
jgi:hypothetical protein